ncbi:MAG: hypothetical protein D6758_08575 [Gammaproteobacteria bacterium]|nr:MAG: hypothetical protein D6758_08575 [Gammaproteobacteria bacterium]
MTPESLVLLINLTIIVVGYLIVFPRTAGNDLKRLFQSDLCASLAALAISGNRFMGTGVTFSFLGLELGWFGFTLMSYLCLEVPFSLWYLKRHGILN